MSECDLMQFLLRQGQLELGLSMREVRGYLSDGREGLSRLIHVSPTELELDQFVDFPIALLPSRRLLLCCVFGLQ